MNNQLEKLFAPPEEKPKKVRPPKKVKEINLPKPDKPIDFSGLRNVVQ